MGRKSLKESRQKEIIVAFYQVSRKLGLENASIAKVADHMGINPSLILHYFKTKDALYKGLVNFILERYSRIYRTGPETVSSFAQVEELIDALFSRKWNDLIDDGVFYSCYAQIYRTSSLRKAFRELHDALRSYLARVLKDARDQDVIQIQDVDETVEIIFALVEGAYYYLGMVRDRAAYKRKLLAFRNHAVALVREPVNA